MHEQSNHSNPSSITYQLEGETVDWATGFGVGALHIDVVDFDGLCTDLVARAKTDACGHFSITLTSEYIESLFPGRIPSLAFRVYTYITGGEVPIYQKFTDPVETWTPATPIARVRIALDMEEDLTVTTPALSMVRGRVMNASGEPVAGATVRAYDKGLSANNPLDYYTTDGTGWYYIGYSTASLSRLDKIHADLIVRAFSSEDEDEEDLIAETSVICHAPTTAIINLVTDNIAYHGRPEESRVYASIIAVIGETAPIDDLTEDQISYIACTMEMDRTLIETYVTAADIAQSMGLPAGAIYALLRQGITPTSRGILAHRRAILRQAL